MMSSIFGLISRRVAGKYYYSRAVVVVGGRQFCSGHEELLRAAAPCLMLPPTFEDGKRLELMYNFYSPVKAKAVRFGNRGGYEENGLILSDDTVFVGASHGWLALLSSRSRDVFLLNPLSGRRVDLPALGTKPVQKVILSCSPERKDCRALAILGSYGNGRAAICRPGGNWSVLDGTPSGGYYVDFVYSAARGRFLGLMHSSSLVEELEAWEVSIDEESTLLRQRLEEPVNKFSWLYFNSIRLGRSTENPRGTHPMVGPRYLVYEEQSDQLFLVRRYEIARDRIEYDISVRRFLLHDPERIAYDVYKIHSNREIEPLSSSLDDLAMFVGINHSFAVKAAPGFNLKPNSIYFSDSRVQMIEDKHDKTSQTLEVFDYQTKTCSPVYYPSRHHHHLLPMPWLIPTLN